MSDTEPEDTRPKRPDDNALLGVPPAPEKPKEDRKDGDEPSTTPEPSE